MHIHLVWRKCHAVEWDGLLELTVKSLHPKKYSKTSSKEDPISEVSSIINTNSQPASVLLYFQYRILWNMYQPWEVGSKQHDDNEIFLSNWTLSSWISSYLWKKKLQQMFHKYFLRQNWTKTWKFFKRKVQFFYFNRVPQNIN